MAIDKSGKWWKSDEYEDLVAYLKDYTEDGYPAELFAKCVCACGGVSFQLVGSPEEGFAKRICTGCGSAHLVCDSQEHWDDELAEEFACPCESEEFELGVGFSMRTGAQLVEQA